MILRVRGVKLEGRSGVVLRAHSKLVEVARCLVLGTSRRLISRLLGSMVLVVVMAIAMVVDASK